MVKGNTRQVIVVRAPDARLFEQAIFLLREDALEQNGVSEEELLSQARRAADSYLLKHSNKRKKRLPPIAWASVGAAATAFLWILTVL